MDEKYPGTRCLSTPVHHRCTGGPPPAPGIDLDAVINHISGSLARSSGEGISLQTNQHPSSLPLDRGDGGRGARTGGAIRGLGVDLCAIARLQRALVADETGVLTAVFTPAELAACRAGAATAARLAACFAAKEAVLKALAGCGGPETFWQDIEIRTDDDRLHVNLGGRLAELAATHGIRQVLVSAARCRRYAVATALALA